MSDEIPIGQRESDKLEFKSRDVLRDRGSIATAIAAFLNADGGTLWIGVAEQDGVAAAVEPVAEAQRTASALLDYLVDTLDPPPRTNEVIIHSVPVANGEVLKVDIRTGALQPYAAMRGTARSYVIRVGARVRALTNAELRAMFVQPRETTAPASVSNVRTEIDDAAKTGRRELWFVLEPSPPLSVRAAPLKRLEELLRDPAVTGDRPMGWTLHSRYNELEPSLGEYRFGRPDSYHRTIVRDSGAVVFIAPLERLQRMQGPAAEIFPYALLEFPVSVCRFARELYRAAGVTPDASTTVAATLALLGVRGWKLRPFSPRSIGYEVRGARAYDDADDLIIGPLKTKLAEFDASPDRLAMRAAAEVYRAFHFEEDQFPAEYDPKTGVLSLPA